MGRPRLSLEEKQLRGTVEKARERKYKELDQKSENQNQGSLYPDKGFTKAERDKFDELAYLLKDNSHIGAKDSPALQNLARLLVELRSVERYLKKNGHTYIFLNREHQEVPKRRPESVLRQELVVNTTRLLGEFGLSPKARGDHKKIDSDSANDDFDMFPGGKQ